MNKDFWKDRKVFVTGHTGFKGTWLLAVLEILGADVTGFALNQETEPNLWNIRKPRCKSLIGDIRDYSSLEKAYKEAYTEAAPDIVIHMAAQPLVLTAYKIPRYTYETNIMGTVNLLECVRTISGGDKVSVLNVTTDKVYYNSERDEGYKEDEILDGWDPYSNSKSCSELVTAAYRRSLYDADNTAVSTARSGNVIGGGDFADNRIIPDCARAGSKGERVGLRNPASTRPYLHVLDTLFAYLLIAESQYLEHSFSGSYNIGPDVSQTVTSGELAGMFCRAWGEGLGWEYIKTDNPKESGMLGLDCSKIARVFGWKPLWNTSQAVCASAEWYKAYYADPKSGMANEIMNRQIKEFLEMAL